eukprot:m.45289 g.45289  ORF g.45289 m.45289 type:complete len:146 (+) comp10662_c0_seq1:1960-2397(+)
MSNNPPKKAKKKGKTIAKNLPAGFFDDERKDAEVRNVPLVNKTEQDWKQFQKDIAVEEKESAALIEEDAEESTIHRIMDEMKEQKVLESRVDILKKKRQEAKKNKMNMAEDNCNQKPTNEVIKEDDGSESDDSDWDDGGWRNKAA